jgi:hypothetical protein
MSGNIFQVSPDRSGSRRVCERRPSRTVFAAGGYCAHSPHGCVESCAVPCLPQPTCYCNFDSQSDGFAQMLKLLETGETLDCQTVPDADFLALLTASSASVVL